jgi:hypothetical protein
MPVAKRLVKQDVSQSTAASKLAAWRKMQMMATAWLQGGWPSRSGHTLVREALEVLKNVMEYQVFS